MSTVLKNKLYEYEVASPASAWEIIAVSLDEINSQKKLAQKLYQLEVPAPADAWTKIAGTLDLESKETKFRADVLNLEVEPPSFTWSKIAEQLNTEAQESFSKKIYDYEVAAPVAVWQNIVTVLDAEQGNGSAISIRKNYSRLFRIAAAAAIVGIIVWVGFTFLGNDEKPSTDNTIANTDTKSIAPAPPIETKQPSSTKISEESFTTVKTPANIAPAKSVTNDVRKWTKPLLRKQQEPLYTFTETESHSKSDELAIADAKNLHSNKRKAVATATTDTNTDTRYLVYLTEQGDIVKLSKKLADLKCIYTKDGTVSQDALAKLDAAQCIDQVKFWQEKMANSSLQSSSNPLELIEILK